jgi:hypothetical protein
MHRLTSSAVILGLAQILALAGHGYLYYEVEAKTFATYQIWLAVVNIFLPLIVSRNETRLVASEKHLDFLALAVSWSRNITAVLILTVPPIAFYFFSIPPLIVFVAVLQALTMTFILFAIHLTIVEQSLLRVNILRSVTIMLPPVCVVLAAATYSVDSLSLVIFHFAGTLMLFMYILTQNKNFKKSVISGIFLSTTYRLDLLKSGGVASVNSLARQLPLIFINTFQNTNITADFALVQRIYNAPQSVVGSVATDFLKKKYLEGKLIGKRTMFVVTTLFINLLVFSSILLIMIVASQVIDNDRSDNLITLSLVIIAPFVIKSVSSPLSAILILKDKFTKDMMFQLVLVTITVLAFALVDTIEAYITVFSIVTSLFYLVYGFVSFYEMRVNKDD